MADYERHENHHMPHERDWGASVRTIMQGLILAGVLWLAKSVSDQNASIAGMQVQLADIKATFDGVPAMKDRITVLEQRQADLVRRIEAQEPTHNNIKGWTR